MPLAAPVGKIVTTLVSPPWLVSAVSSPGWAGARRKPQLASSERLSLAVGWDSSIGPEQLPVPPPAVLAATSEPSSMIGGLELYKPAPDPPDARLRAIVTPTSVAAPAVPPAIASPPPVPDTT